MLLIVYCLFCIFSYCYYLCCYACAYGEFGLNQSPAHQGKSGIIQLRNDSNSYIGASRTGG